MLNLKNLRKKSSVASINSMISETKRNKIEGKVHITRTKKSRNKTCFDLGIRDKKIIFGEPKKKIYTESMQKIRNIDKVLKSEKSGKESSRSKSYLGGVKKAHYEDKNWILGLWEIKLLNS